MASIQEPPLVKATIPYVGHLIGIMQSKNYFVELRQVFRMPDKLVPNIIPGMKRKPINA